MKYEDTELVIAVTRRGGGFFLRVKTVGSQVIGTNLSNSVQIGSTAEENKHAGEWTDGQTC